jgi:hypothetical protein
MNPWREILLALGGNATLLLVLAFLSRSLLQTWLTKDIKKFETDLKGKADSELERLKAELKAEGDVSIEQLKGRLQLAATEHEVRFSNLHQKRAEVIADLYQRLVKVSLAGERFVYQLSLSNEEYLETLDRIQEFATFYETNRIYFSVSGL